MSLLPFGFPPGFRFGVATAALQIEGAAEMDGKELSNWDLFSTRPGAIYDGHRPTHAARHYERLDEDLALIAELGVDAYRFSISWPRVLPAGRGQPNRPGLDFYERLIDGLLERNVTPYLTLFHWDLPQELESLGGFSNRNIVGWFAEYTELIARRFGDRVHHYLTLNEPHAFIEGGLRHGRHAPGHRLPLRNVLLAGHHALLCHGVAVDVLRAEVEQAFITAAPALLSAIPETPTAEDTEAARQYTFTMRSTELRVSAWWMDPIYRGSYPESGLLQFGTLMPPHFEADLAKIYRPLDAFGCNLYDAVTVRAGLKGTPEVVPLAPGSPRTAFNWAVTPDAHYYGPKFASERYQLPVLITENGLSTRDWVALDGGVHDPERVDFLASHLSALKRATDEFRVLGYFHWSLLDNFEWNHGYRERFGLVHVDYDTFERTKKDSFESYRTLIAAEKVAHSTAS